MPSPIPNALAVNLKIDPVKKPTEVAESDGFQDLLNGARQKVEPADGKKEAKLSQTEKPAKASKSKKPGVARKAKDQPGETPETVEAPVVPEGAAGDAEVVAESPPAPVTTATEPVDVHSETSNVSLKISTDQSMANVPNPRIAQAADEEVAISEQPIASEPIVAGKAKPIQPQSVKISSEIPQMDEASTDQEPGSAPVGRAVEQTALQEPAKQAEAKQSAASSHPAQVSKTDAPVAVPNDATQSDMEQQPRQQHQQQSAGEGLEQHKEPRLTAAPHAATTAHMSEPAAQRAVATESSAIATPTHATAAHATPTIAGEVQPVPSARHPDAQQLQPQTLREAEFARNNHDQIVTNLRAQLLPRGGAMQMRLDPPELGMLQVAVRMQDGIMSISFQTSNDEATKLLSHSLTHLKHVLESQGVSVDKIHVQQAPKNEQSDRQDADEQQRGNLQDEASARQEQQRKEMLRRMWRKLAIGSDPLDLVA